MPEIRLVPSGGWLKPGDGDTALHHVTPSMLVKTKFI